MSSSIGRLDPWTEWFDFSAQFFSAAFLGEFAEMKPRLGALPGLLRTPLRLSDPQRVSILLQINDICLTVLVKFPQLFPHVAIRAPCRNRATSRKKPHAKGSGQRRSDGDGEELLSFAATTDEPPLEVIATGHDRCIWP